MPSKLAPGIRQKRPGYFEVRVYGGLDPATGNARQVTRTVRGTVKDANALRAQLLTEVADKGVAVRKSATELFDAVIEHLEALGREPTTLLSYRSMGLLHGWLTSHVWASSPRKDGSRAEEVPTRVQA